MKWPLEQNPIVRQGMCSLSLRYHDSIVSYVVDLTYLNILPLYSSSFSHGQSVMAQNVVVRLILLCCHGACGECLMLVVHSIEHGHVFRG